MQTDGRTLNWCPTWPGEKRNQHDWHVPADSLAHPQDVLRIFKVVGGQQNGKWYWTSSRLQPPGGDGVRRNRRQDGFCVTAKEARLAAEELYGTD